jgi:hypothetical protein
LKGTIDNRILLHCINNVKVSSEEEEHSNKKNQEPHTMKSTYGKNKKTGEITINQVF